MTWPFWNWFKDMKKCGSGWMGLIKLVLIDLGVLEVLGYEKLAWSFL